MKSTFAKFIKDEGGINSRTITFKGIVPIAKCLKIRYAIMF